MLLLSVKSIVSIAQHLPLVAVTIGRIEKQQGKRHRLAFSSEHRSCVKVEVAALGFPSLTVLMVSVDVKRHWIVVSQSSGAVWKSKWPPWAPIPHRLYGFGGRKATLNLNLAFVTIPAWKIGWNVPNQQSSNAGRHSKLQHILVSKLLRTVLYMCIEYHI